MKTIRINAKCSDLFWAALSKDGKRVGEINGYVPAWFPNPAEEHYGDYVSLEIDVVTGQILNWKKPTAANLKDFKTPLPDVIRQPRQHQFADCGGYPRCVTCGCDEDDAFVGGQDCI